VRNTAASLSPKDKALNPKFSLTSDHVKEKPVKIYRNIFKIGQKLFFKDENLINSF